MNSRVNVIDNQVPDDALTKQRDPCTCTPSIGLDVLRFFDTKGSDDVSKKPGERRFTAWISKR